LWLKVQSPLVSYAHWRPYCDWKYKAHWWVMLIEDLIVTESTKPIGELCSLKTLLWLKVQSPFVQWFEICGVEWWMVIFFYTEMTTVSLLTDLTSETNHFVKVKCWKYACCAYIYLTENKVLLFIKGL
jgi:hypothetical protein